MRLIRASLLAALGIVVAAQGIVPGAAAASAATPPEGTSGSSARAGIQSLQPLQAVQADSVVGHYGVGIHTSFLDTPYQDTEAVADALEDLGVRHVRDDLNLNAPLQYPAIKTIADRGIGFDLIMGRPGSAATAADYVNAVADQLPAGSVESLEGVNEWDYFGPDDPADWVPQMKAWQQDLYTAAKANPATAGLPVLSPALAFRWNYAVAGDMSQHADIANAHMYPGGYKPTNQIAQITAALRTSIPEDVVGPLVTTEAGYHNALSSDPARHLPVPEDVAGIYLPRMLLEHFNRGERRMYSYELIDEYDDPGVSEPEAYFGLLRHDLTPKPAYTAMKSLLGLLADPGPAFTPGSLPVTVDGFPNDGRYLLTQRRDGRFVLLLWRDVGVYDPVAREREQVDPADVTLRLAEPAGITVYRPSAGPEPVSDHSRSELPLQLDGAVTALVIDPERPPEPVEVSARRGNSSAGLTWDLPSSPVDVTGFEVTRRPGALVQTLPAGARSYADSHLVNGRRYTYGVRALSGDRSSPAVTTSVVPATVPAAPRIRWVRPGKRKVTLSWAAAGPRGSRVMAYQLRYLGRTKKVGPARRKATIDMLPAGRRLKVGIRARNHVGWGAVSYSKPVRTRR